MRSPSQSSDGRLAEINIIPLVDIMLVLLIIFMVTAPMLKEGIDINLPEVSAESVQTTKEEFVLSIDSNGSVYLDDDPKQKYSAQSIETRLVEMFKDQPKKEIYLKADKGINYGYVVEVMAACQRAGIERIGMITIPPKSKK